MNFTPKANVGLVVSGILAIVVGLIGWTSHAVPGSPRMVATQVAYTEQESIQNDQHLRIVPATDTVQATGSQTIRPVHHWYKSKHWWKKNAPIVGGAGGGALIGGLAGGGTGAVVGGAVGGGGGYLYKHLKHHHHH